MAIRDLVPWNRNRDVQVRRVGDALPAFHRAFDSLFDDFFRGFDLAPFGRSFDELWNSRLPALDLQESEKEYTVRAELPGWDEKDIEVSVTGDTLTIKGEQQSESEEGEKDSDGYRQSARYGAFRRSIRLPAEVDRDRVSAATNRGVLTVTLPKTEAAQKQSRKIEIKAA